MNGGSQSSPIAPEVDLDQSLASFVILTGEVYSDSRAPKLSALFPISVIMRGRRPTGLLDASWIPPPRTSQSHPDRKSTL